MDRTGDRRSPGPCAPTAPGTGGGHVGLSAAAVEPELPSALSVLLLWIMLVMARTMGAALTERAPVVLVAPRPCRTPIPGIEGR